MNPTSSANAGLQPVAQERGLAKLNPQPKRAYEIVLTIDNAPGPFAVVEGSAQYDVINEDDCGHVNDASGTAERITSNEPFTLSKVSDTEYRGPVYLDRMQDEDYYGRGVCRWELTEVRANLRASGADGETLFIPAIKTAQMVSGSPVEQYFWKARYPRAEMDNYPYFGRAETGEFKPEIQDELFEIKVTATSR